MSFKNSLLVIMVFVTTFTVTAQKLNLNHLLSSDGDVNKKQRFPLRDNFDGSVYLYNNWNKIGTVTTDQGKYAVPGINYNIDSGMFEFKVSKDSIFIMTPTEIKSVEVGDNVFKYNVLNDRKYVQVLLESPKISFYKTFTLQVKMGRYNPLTGKSSSNTYHPKSKYALVFDGDITDNFKLNKKSILRLLDSQKSKIETFVKQNKLSYRKDTDIIKVFEYYNKL